MAANNANSQEGTSEEDDTSFQSDSTITPSTRLFYYHTPKWFNAQNIKSLVELGLSKPRIQFTDLESPTQSTSDDTVNDMWHLSRKSFLKLRDMTAAAFVRNSKGYLDQKESNIILRSTDTPFIEGVDETMIKLAKVLKATLISIDREDLRDLAEEFLRQDKPKQSFTADEAEDASECPQRYYFAVQSVKNTSKEDRRRNRAAISAILEAAEAKDQAHLPIERTGREEVSHFSTNVILYIRSVYQIGMLSGNYRYFARFRDAVQNSRKRGKGIIMVANMLKEEPYYHTKTYKNIGASLSSTLDISPYQRQVGGVPSEPCRDLYTMTSNIRRLKRFLRAKSPLPSSAQFLDPLSNWDPLGDSLGDSRWSRNYIREAGKQIIRRYLAMKTMTLEDVRVVLSDLNLPREPWKDRFERVKKDYDGLENSPLDYVVSLGKCICPIPCCNILNTVLTCFLDQLNETYDDVNIDPEAKEIIKSLVSLYDFRFAATPNVARRTIRTRSALLYGPPGTDRAHLGRAVAKDLGATLISIDAPAILSKWDIDMEKYIGTTLKIAAELFPCVVFIDEVHALFYQRTQDNVTWLRTQLAWFLKLLGRLTRTENAPFVIFTTTRPYYLDEAFLGRVPQKLLFKLPDAMTRLKIIRLFVTNDNLLPPFNTDHLVDLTEGYTHSDIFNLCNEVGRTWLVECADIGTDPSNCNERIFSNEAFSAGRLRLEDFLEALQEIRPTASPRSLGDVGKDS